MFLLSQNDENQSENGSKNSKIRLRARPPAEPQKKMLQTKKLRSKSWKTRVFFTFRLPILDGRVHEQVSSVLFFTVFFEGERHDLSKTGGFGRKMPPPGKPVTFYECHPDDHAPAPSVRADLDWNYWSLVLDRQHAEHHEWTSAAIPTKGWRTCYGQSCHPSAANMQNEDGEPCGIDDLKQKTSKDSHICSGCAIGRKQHEACVSMCRSELAESDRILWTVDLPRRSEGWDEPMRFPCCLGDFGWFWDIYSIFWINFWCALLILFLFRVASAVFRHRSSSFLEVKPQVLPCFAYVLRMRFFLWKCTTWKSSMWTCTSRRNQPQLQLFQTVHGKTAH